MTIELTRETDIPWSFPIDTSLFASGETPVQKMLQEFYIAAKALRDTSAVREQDPQFIEEFTRVTSGLMELSGILEGYSNSIDQQTGYEGLLRERQPKAVRAKFEFAMRSVINAGSHPEFPGSRYTFSSGGRRYNAKGEVVLQYGIIPHVQEAQLRLATPVLNRD